MTPIPILNSNSGHELELVYGTLESSEEEEEDFDIKSDVVDINNI